MSQEEELYNSFLLKQFDEFYHEVIRQKKNVKLYTENSSAKEVSEASEEAQAEKATIHPIQLILLNMLEQQVVEARRQGGEYGVAFYKEIQYVMASLADEIFLNMDWEGKAAWKSNLLESQLFGTYFAGEHFFQKVDKLLKDRDPAYTEMAAVYLLALSLGFKGKFSGNTNGSHLEFYRRQLYAFIFKSKPGLLVEGRKLFPDTYAHTLEHGSEGRLPYLKWWIGLIALLIVVFLIVSHGIWTHVTSDLIEIVEKIIWESKTIT